MYAKCKDAYKDVKRSSTYAEKSALRLAVGIALVMYSTVVIAAVWHM